MSRVTEETTLPSDELQQMDAYSCARISKSTYRRRN
jgi:hypothetical protein